MSSSSSSRQSSLPLSDRAQHLFRLLVERYIAEGQPVGSRTLARDAGMDLSPATIRNVMADLEDFGLIRSPHTSAGRIPTVQGYRLFVDSMMTMRAPAESEVLRLNQDLYQQADVTRLLARTSSMLSDFTQLTSIVMIPRTEQQALRQVEFLPLSDNRVLAILILNEREVQNRIIHTQRDYSRAELEQAANYLNQAFAGKDLIEVRDQLVAELSRSQAQMNSMMQTVVDVAGQALAPAPASEAYVISGQTHLMADDHSSIIELRQVFEAFNQQRDILHLLDQAVNADGVQIFIGEESGYDVLSDYSVVTRAYSDGDRKLGVLAVVGPTRMAYERVVPIVDVTAKVLGAALKSLV